MPVLMGIDLGEKRIGIAISDEGGKIAMPLKTVEVPGRQKLLSALNEIIEEYQVSKIVVGLPKTLKGEMGIAAQKIVTHVEWLKQQVPKPWILWDERLTTQEVERILLEANVNREKRRKVRDKLAAQRILQSYIDHLGPKE